MKVMNKIFVSSTCYDLIDLRAEVEHELQNMGLIPIMSDRLSSEFEIQTDKNSIETCLVNLRNSDAVILILSQRYGPSLKKAGFEDISATHLEYREAMKHKIPIYLYVRNRTEADYILYSETNNPDLLKWVNPKEVGIFTIFNEHRKLSNSDKNNWYYPFSDVVDLKRRLQIDLKKNSSSAILNQITKTGQAPCVIISELNCRIVPNSLLLSLHLKSKNIGNSVAIEPNLICYYSEEYYESENKGENPEIEDDWIRVLSTLMIGDEVQSDYEFILTQEQFDEGQIDLVFENAYAMITGHYLADISEVSITWKDRVITETHKHYETKKYFHANAIKHSI